MRVARILSKAKQFTNVIPIKPTSNTIRPLSRALSTNSYLENRVDALNGAIAISPTITGACFIGCDMASMGLSYGSLLLLQIPISAEFALAFVLSRPFRRLRLPVEMLLAEGMGRMVPALTKVRLSQVFSGGIPIPKQWPGETISQATWRTLQPVKSIHKDPKEALQALGSAALLVLDRYGVAYTLSSRLAGLSVVSMLYVLLSSGVDVQGWLETHGWGAAGNVAGTWAAAVVSASALYPGSLLAVSYLAPRLARR